MLTIDANGKPHTSITGPKLVSPLRRVTKALTLGNGHAFVRVHLQPNKSKWQEIAEKNG
jgi:hypothetical protein